MRLILLLLVVLSGLNTMALSYEGKILKSNSQLLFLDINDRNSYSLVGATAIITTYLNKLSVNDFISIDGTKNELQKTLTVQSVNYIGLSALLGSWFGDDFHCYNFTSFTEFSISRRSFGKKCLPSITPSYAYFVNPTANSWVMLLAGDRGSYVGDLTIIGPKDIEIKLYDSETSDILRKIRLRK